MADISNELQAIKTAVYGEEVRGSIHDGIKKINDEMEEAIEDIGDYADTLSDYVKDICPSALVSGGLISISDAAPLKVDSAVVRIVLAQTGSGTPSPENVRPFTGFTGANVYHGADQEEYDTIAVAFPSAAGTVYGGTLDLTAGTLTVDVAYALLNDASKWTSNANSSYNFLYDVNFSNRKKYSDSFTGLVCSYCNNAGTSSVDTVRWTSASSNKMGMKLANGTLDQVKADATAGKIAIVYDLAEPVVHTLDPVTLTMLRGVNILWADCGEMDLTYRQDVVHLIKAMLNPNEDDMVANTYYPEDSFFSINGKLYKATIAITSGESIVPGANGNCAETSIAEQLTAIYTILNA